MVEVGLDPPEVRIAPTGSITITVHLHGHLTDQVTGLIQNSARVAIEFELRYFPRAAGSSGWSVTTRSCSTA